MHGFRSAPRGLEPPRTKKSTGASTSDGPRRCLRRRLNRPNCGVPWTVGRDGRDGCCHGLCRGRVHRQRYNVAAEALSTSGASSLWSRVSRVSRVYALRYMCCCLTSSCSRSEARPCSRRAITRASTMSPRLNVPSASGSGRCWSRIETRSLILQTGSPSVWPSRGRSDPLDGQPGGLSYVRGLDQSRKALSSEAAGSSAGDAASWVCASGEAWWALRRQQVAPLGVTLILGGIGVGILGVALILLVLRMLLDHAFARDVEATQLKGALNEVI
jgi:hypothetical protein